MSEHVSHFPNAVAGRRGKLTLLAFSPASRRYATPVVLVPALIGAPTLFDLAPEASLVGALLAHGFAVYLVDWGRYGYEDRDLSLETVVTGLLDFVARRVRAREGRGPVAFVGYCMGGTLVALGAALGIVRAIDPIVALAAPVAFGDGGGRLVRWCAPDVLDLDRVLHLFGNVPAHMIEAAFLLLRPTARVRARLAESAAPDRAPTRAAIARWAETWLDLPGAFARDWIGALYRGNLLATGRLRLGGRAIHLGAIRSPLLVLAADGDTIAPRASCEPLAAAVGSSDVTFTALPGGHIALIAGRPARSSTYAIVASWLASRTGSRSGA